MGLQHSSALTVLSDQHTSIQRLSDPNVVSRAGLTLYDATSSIYRDGYRCIFKRRPPRLRVNICSCRVADLRHVTLLQAIVVELGVLPRIVQAAPRLCAQAASASCGTAAAVPAAGSRDAGRR